MSVILPPSGLEAFIISLFLPKQLKGGMSTCVHSPVNAEGEMSVMGVKSHQVSYESCDESCRSAPAKLVFNSCLQMHLTLRILGN